VKKHLPAALFLSLLLLAPPMAGLAASSQATTGAPLPSLAELPGVSGYEGDVSTWLAERLAQFQPQVDNLGNVVVTLGTGAPHRLLVTSIDEPGYVVSAVTDDGYLRVQRLPQAGLHPWFDLLHSAQPVEVLTRSGKRVPGIAAGLSVHLHRDIPPSERTDDVERMYIDVGARSREEVRSLGIDLLDPITLEKHAYHLANGELTAPFVGDRAAAAALVNLLESLDTAQLSGTLSVAFVGWHYMGNQGLDRLLKQVQPDEVIFVERLDRSQARPGEGVLVTSFENGDITLAVELLGVARENQIAVRAELPEAPPRGRYTGPLPLPARAALLGVPVLFAQTPAAVVSLHEVAEMKELLARYLGVTLRDLARPAETTAEAGQQPGKKPTAEEILRALAPVYGVSGFEDPVAEEVYKLLPDWAKQWAFEDAAGNLIVPLGQVSEKPSLVFIAHLDEIGWVVKEIRDDGRLVLDRKGGFLPEHFLGHAVLVHTADGDVPAVLELPPSYRRTGYNDGSVPYVAYTGAKSASEVEERGIHTGDSVSVPKKFRQLAGTRVSARSFDDRVGATALLAALRALNPQTIDREVTFVFSTREEIGLEGAAHFAARAAEGGGTPDYVFAVDTFVSADSPLESPRYALGVLGEGFVLRAVDHSNVTPRPLVDCVVRLAHDKNIPVQYGVTGGGNDGAVFVPYGAVDIPLAWPLRYSHTAGEVTDMKDVEALSHIVAALAQAAPECTMAHTGGK
jgi:putative aminopeptidase FrvX